MKVFFDIITNHTADVIDYREGSRPAYVVQGPRAVPHRVRHAVRRRRLRGAPGASPRSAPSARSRTPGARPGERTLKVPDWLNDVTLYHNRGDTTFTGENSLYGDFFGSTTCSPRTRASVAG
jgi:hypothetical protein